jgi:hypothetical protein
MCDPVQMADTWIWKRIDEGCLRLDCIGSTLSLSSLWLSSSSAV